MSTEIRKVDRRGFIGSASAAALFAPSLLRAQEQSSVRRNVSSFLTHQWQDHFDKIGKGILLSDTNTMVLQHWTADGEMRIYPTSVPLSDDLTKRGYTEVVDKRVAPGWGPTPAMRIRNPEWPAYIQGGDPLNPLGSHAIYLSWQYYRIHGTQDTRKIGRKSSNGCIGLYNEHIAEVFSRTPVGTQVKLL
ncbi:L,D-transpeptidase-like protein [Litoreibacter halocynthiae]|uniref:L,D-transpeptidase-like protein n=1 Tax=Litoreibacter halocynthiae TaxID=1242689 RepID=A0A4R7LC58_9RHOB|nr:L,D-transpeptidase [Litoreibacter halocynthiae]TDT72704.1 L,D-transpeptidase-like protein [Litoreibacter halocynthiae]